MLAQCIPLRCSKRGIHAQVLLQVEKLSNAIRTTCLTYLLCLGEDLDRLFTQGHEVSTHKSGSGLQEGLDTQPSAFLRLSPGSGPAPCKCIACIGAPCSPEVPERVGVSGELVCAPGWGA